MYKKILVAIDDSYCGHLALEEAIRLAKTCSAHLDILHVIDYGFLKHDLGYEAFSAIRAKLAAIGRGLLADASKHVTEAQVPYEIRLVDQPAVLGDIANEIENIARASSAQIIVVGTHGRSGIGRLVLGSVAESLARVSPVPVLLVRGPATTEDAVTNNVRQLTEAAN